MREIPSLMLWAVNRLLAGVRKDFISSIFHCEISLKYFGNSLIPLHHLERRPNIDLFGWLCSVQGYVLFSMTVSVFKGKVIGK